MTSYKTIYLMYIILCLMAYTDSGNKSEEQELCLKNLLEDFDYPDETIFKEIMTLPRKAFKDIVFNKFKTSYGVNYYFKMIEKAATGLTKSPRKFCKDYEYYNIVLPEQSTLCMEQLRLVFQFTNEDDTLSIIKWTYVHITKSNIPEKFKIKFGDKVVEFDHFAFEYFNHMYQHLDLYNSFPKPVVFCQGEEPNLFSTKHQNYEDYANENPEENPGENREEYPGENREENPGENPGENREESSRGEATIKELRRTAAYRRLKEKKNLKHLSFDD